MDPISLREDLRQALQRQQGLAGILQHDVTHVEFEGERVETDLAERERFFQLGLCVIHGLAADQLRHQLEADQGIDTDSKH